MTVLHIEHPVPSFEDWKKAFDADPIDRKTSGVKSYKLFRSVSDPNYVAVDLEFDSIKNAESTLKKLMVLWGQVDGRIMTGPKVQLFDVIGSGTI